MRSTGNDWSGAQLPIYVINLDSRPERWRLQTRQARLRRLVIERWPASNAVEGSARFPGSTVSDGAKGLWLSFETLYEKLSAEGVAAAIVLEDDVLLGPFFKRRVRRVLRSVPETAAIVQLGYLGDSAWRTRNSALKNVRKVLRPRSRWRDARARGWARERSPLVGGALRAGTHSLLLRPQALPDLTQVLRPGALPLDRAFAAAAKRHPAIFWRSQRNLAYQLPLRSDIPWSHHRETAADGERGPASTSGAAG